MLSTDECSSSWSRWHFYLSSIWAKNRKFLTFLRTKWLWVWVPPGPGLFPSLIYPISSVSLIMSLTEVQHFWFSYKICLAVQLEVKQPLYAPIEQKQWIPFDISDGGSFAFFKIAKCSVVNGGSVVCLLDSWKRDPGSNDACQRNGSHWPLYML